MLNLKDFLRAEREAGNLSRYIASMFNELDVPTLRIGYIAMEAELDEGYILDALKMRGIELQLSTGNDQDEDYYKREQFANELVLYTGERIRPVIPVEVRREVYNLCGGMCVECDSRFDLQYDHILPWSKGGATTVENLQLLCAPCNRTKSDSI
jgi:hypothetical protein